MSMEDVILVATVREEIRGGALRVDEAGIQCHIEVAQAGNVIRPLSKDIYWNTPKSGRTWQQSDSTMVSAVKPSVEAEDSTAMERSVASPLGPEQRATKEGDIGESDVKLSVSLYQVVLEMQCE